MQDDDFFLTPFDPSSGILFKYGRVFLNRGRQLNDFEQAIGAKVPADFLELIGEYCEGGFDGYYRVYFQDGVEVGWHHLLLMKHPDEHDWPDHNTLRIIRDGANRFFDDRGMALLPFGRAYVMNRAEQNNGYLAFDLRDANKVVCLPDAPGQRIAIADSFREMMLGSQFVFFG